MIFLLEMTKNEKVINRMNHPLISVIIPVYNTAQYLPRCLDSIIANDYQKLEIICINDGSTDNSLYVLQEYKEKDNRIVVIDSPHSGVSKTRNKGLDRASGEYIAFVDSDDWIHKEFFSVLLRLQKLNDSDVVICEFFKTDKYVIDAEKYSEEVELFQNDEAMKGTRKRYIGGRLFKRSFIGDTLFSEELKIGEDTVFNIDCYAKRMGIKTVCTNSQLYYYYQRAESATQSADNDYYYSLGKVYTDRANRSSNTYSTMVYLRQAYRELLLSRKLTKDKDHNDDIQNALKEAAKVLKKKNPFSCKETIMYDTFKRFPFVYRFLTD